MAEQAQLKRSLTLPLITFYGIGTILGAGIYVLIGKVAVQAGMFAPLSFLAASIVAAFTGLSYAEMASRYPKSAGEAVYIKEGFRWLWLSTLVGWLVVSTGIISAATIANGFVGYLHLFIHMPDALAISIIVIAMGAIAAWGITESVSVVTIITLMEIGGLILVISVVGDSLLTLPDRWHELIPSNQYPHVWTGVGLGAFLAFYAFIGFEDMVNCAEEVKNPQKTLPRAIIISLIVSAILYMLVALVAVLALGADELAKSDAPLASVVHDGGGYSPVLIGLISLVAVLNGALVQIIMASRVIYGLGKQRSAPKFLSYIHPKRQTPVVATLLVTIVVLALALWFPLVTLAKTTSFIILIIFSMVNLSLIIVKKREPRKPGCVNYPMIVPLAGLLLCVAFLSMQVGI